MFLPLFYKISLTVFFREIRSSCSFDVSFTSHFANYPEDKPWCQLQYSSLLLSGRPFEFFFLIVVQRGPVSVASVSPL